MKIGIDGTPLTISYHCGVRHYAQSLLEALVRVDKTNDYVVFLPGNSAVSLSSRFKTVYLPSVVYLKRQVFLPMAVARETADVFHYLEPYGSIFLNHPRIVTTVHDNNLVMTYPWFSRYFLNRLHCEVSRRAVFGRSKALIAVSGFVAEETRHYFPDLTRGQNVTVCHNGYDREVFYRENNAKDENYLLAMGDFTYRKNLKRVFEAFARYRERGGNYRLKVVVSKSGFIQQFLSLVQSLSLTEVVDWLCGIDSKALARYYRGAQVFLYPSLYEGFGLPIIEAMACGCPVITSNFGAMKEIANRAALLVDPYNIEEMCMGIERVTEAKTRTVFVENGYRLVQKYSWEEHAKKVLKVYQEVNEAIIAD